MRTRELNEKNKRKYGLTTSQLISKRKRQMFLEALARTGKVNLAAEAAGYATSNVLRQYYHDDPEFAAAWDAALQTAVDDVLEPEAWRRAVEGVEEDVYYQGESVGKKLNYSDGLLMFLLKGNRPEKYKNNVDVNANVNLDTGIAVMPMIDATVDDWEKKALENQSEYVDVQPERVEDEDDES